MSHARTSLDPVSMAATLGLRYKEAVSRTSASSLHRALDPYSGETFLLKIVDDDGAWGDVGSALRSELEIATYLSRHVESAATPLRFVEREGGGTIVYEDRNGQALQVLLWDAELSSSDKLDIAVSIAAAVRDIHSCGVNHFNLCPAKILVFRTGKGRRWRAQVVDFGVLRPRVGSRQARDLRRRAETLRYLAPEQSARDLPTPDHRSDLYTLGVILYELFAGVPPFVQKDPVALLHAHLAQAPSPLEKQAPDIPIMVAGIVEKLLRKTPSERYQSAAGLLYDLARCYEEGGARAAFAIGSHDVSDRLTLPERLYGREREIGQLLHLFGEARDGERHVVLVHGYSGVGKTSLVREIIPHVVAQGGHVVSGKFDQYKGDLPYDGFVQGVLGLVRQILTEPEDRIQVWRDKILSTMGDNGGLIARVIPDLELVVGPQPEPLALGPDESKHRFNHVFQEFLRLFMTPEHPLMLFLDDLQWADSASLQLFARLATERGNGHLLLVGAYRANEVDGGHPLSDTIDGIRKKGGVIRSMRVADLSSSDVQRLLDDTLGLPLEHSMALVDLTVQKTGGNPFFLVQLLSALYDDGAISYESALGRWRYDILAIEKRNLSDNVVALMLDKIGQLPPSTRGRLRVASCIGGRFDVDLVAEVCGVTEYEVLGDLWPALKQGLITPAQGTAPEENALRLVKTYRFCHDRIQQAAYSQGDPGERAELHLAIGRRMMVRPAGRDFATSVFLVAEQLLAGVDRVAGAEAAKRVSCAEVFLVAGRRASQTAAYELAKRYLETGLRLLGDHRGDATDRMVTELIVELAETLHVLADFSQAETLIEEGLSRVLDTVTRSRLITLHIQGLYVRHQNEEAIVEGRAALATFGFRLATTGVSLQIAALLIRSRRFMSRLQESDLDAMKDVTDEKLLAVSKISMAIGICALRCRPEILALIILQHLVLFKKHGVFPETALALAGFGILLTGQLHNAPEGERVAKLADHLTERDTCFSRRGHTRFVVHTTIRPWREHLASTLEDLQQLEVTLLNGGNLEYATLSVHTHDVYAFFTGAPLAGLARVMKDSAKRMEEAGQQGHLDYQRMYQIAVQSLRKEGKGLDGTIVDFCDYTRIRERWGKTHDGSGLYTVHLLQLLLHYMGGRFDLAVAAADGGEIYEDALAGMAVIPFQHFFAALARLAWVRSFEARLTPKERRRALRMVRRSWKKLTQWAGDAPMNYAHKAHLVEAEMCRVRGNTARAIALYTRAVQGAKEAGYLQEEALANELAGSFYRSIQQDRVARVFLADALILYERWGAFSKVRQLEASFPVGPAGDVAMAASRQQTVVGKSYSCPVAAAGRIASTEPFEVGGLLRAADALGGELVLDKLLNRVLKALMEMASAGRVILFMQEDGRWHQVAASDGDERDGEWPSAVVNYVGRTGRTVLTGGEEWTTLFGADRYLREKQPRSALCFPLANQGATVGIVYMENRLAMGVFQPDRLDMLRMLSVQAASAIEKVRLYDRLEEQGAELSELLEQQTREVEGATEEMALRSKLYTVDEESAEVIRERLLSMMTDEEVYRDSGLTLEGLAFRAGYSPRSVSEVINACCSKNFYQFVNDFRTEEVKRRLQTPTKGDNVLQIALDAGFASKSSFNAFFKKATGMTPSAYRKRHSKAVME